MSRLSVPRGEEAGREGEGAGAYPSTACERLETKLLSDLGGAHGVLEKSHQSIILRL
jgi:hypothetical protein